MLLVTTTLFPHGDVTRGEILNSLKIWNNGRSFDPGLWDYGYHLLEPASQFSPTVERVGIYHGYDRNAPAWKLVKTILNSLD